MKRFIISSILLLVFIQAYTQAANVDSLFTIWSDTTNSPEVRVEAFYQRFDPIKDESSNKEAVRWSFGIKEVQRLAKEIGKEEYMGRFLLLEIGTYIYIKGEKERGCSLMQT